MSESMAAAHEMERSSEMGDGSGSRSPADPSAPDPAPPVPARSPVRVFGRYELRHQLATGGMASVHLAVTRGSGGFQKVFALKRMHPHLAQERDYVQMFLDEARIAARIDHPNVCAVFDFGECEGEHFMAMELLMGEPYGKVLGKLFKLPPAERRDARRLVISLLADACEGLHAAHELRSPTGEALNVVHRDISPHNLVVTYNGVLKVVDFGVARAAEQHHQTTTGTVKGKFGYMSPEQMRGQPVDRSADVWSLGVVLWESLTGRSLFRRATQSETVLAVTSGRVPALTEIDPTLDAELDAIVQRALALDPAQRFPNARDLGRALRRWVADNGQATDSGEVADWMRHLFPEGLEHKRGLVRRALRDPSPAEPKPAVSASAEGEVQPSHSTVVGRSFSSEARRRSRLRVALPLLLAATVGAAAAWLLVPAREGATGAGAIDEPAARRSVDALRTEPVAATAGEVVSEGPAEQGEDDGAGEPGPDVAPSAGEGDAVADATGDGNATSTAGSGAPTSDAPAAAAPATEEASEDEGSAATRRPRGFGQVNVAARGGWAHVYVGRRRLGPTPGSYRLPAGRHVLRFRGTDGRELARRAVRIRKGRLSRVTVELER